MNGQAAFQVIILGCTGGPREGNVSGYLLSPLNEQQWIALDAGTLLEGIDCAIKKNNLNDLLFTDPVLSAAGEMLRKHVRCYLISHAHLDHIAGLVINSQIDANKQILGINPTIDNLRDHIFNGKIWPNYGNEGRAPILRRYEYVRLALHTPNAIADTSMTVEPHLLSHPHDYPSTAFLIAHKDKYILYFGDTASDLLEEEKHLENIWRRIAPLLKDKKLCGMFLECSFSQETRKDTFGHLNTKFMMHELHHLAEISQMSLEGLKILVTHRKDSLKKSGDAKEIIKQELVEMNDLKVNFLFPQQGDRFIF